MTKTELQSALAEAIQTDKRTAGVFQSSDQCGRLIANVIIYYNTEFD
jgi:hypothetical protein